MAEQDPSERKNFFISYTGADEEWAVWIAWHLEQAGYSTIVQAWDFRPGNNFVVKMDEATREAERTVVVLSPQFLKSNFTPSEWATAFAQDPKGGKRLVVPVLVEKADVEGLLGQIVYVNLTEKEGEEAVSELLAGIQPGRSKPTTAPNFPGQRPSSSSSSAAHASEKPALVWQPFRDELSLFWRSEADKRHQASSAVLELELVPVDDQLIPVRQLSVLADQLVEVGRRGGLFSATQEVEVESRADYVLAQNAQSRYSDDSGLLVTRRGQRGAWIQLPIPFAYEVSFLFVDDTFQYALYAPDPAARWELVPYSPTVDDLDFAQRFIAWNAITHGIQRVDACRTPDGELLLVELEDLNPYLSLHLVTEQQRVAFVDAVVASITALDARA